MEASELMYLSQSFLHVARCISMTNNTLLEPNLIATVPDPKKFSHYRPIQIFHQIVTPYISLQNLIIDRKSWSTKTVLQYFNQVELLHHLSILGFKASRVSCGRTYP